MATIKYDISEFIDAMIDFIYRNIETSDNDEYKNLFRMGQMKKFLIENKVK